MRKLIISLSAVALIAAAAFISVYMFRQAAEPAEELTYTFTNAETGQKFNIISVYKLFADYIAEAKTGSNPNLSSIYKKAVIDPVYSSCYQDAEFGHMADDLINQAPDKLIELNQLSQQLSKHNINELIQESLLKSSTILPGEKPVNICVFPALSPRFQMLTAGTGKIIVPYSFSLTDDMIRVGIAHEYHHHIWAEKYLTPETTFRILDNVVFEGKAVMFEKLIYPDIESTFIYPEYNKKYWSRTEPYLKGTNYDMQSKILYGNGTEYPNAYGYSEGYKMVRSYLDLHPETSPAQWTALSAETIFEEGHYSDHYK